MEKEIKHPSLEGYISPEPEIEGYRLERVFLNKQDGLVGLVAEFWVPIEKIEEIEKAA